MHFFFLNGQVPFKHVQHGFYRDTFVQNRNYPMSSRTCEKEICDRSDKNDNTHIWFEYRWFVQFFRVNKVCESP